MTKDRLVTHANKGYTLTYEDSSAYTGGFTELTAVKLLKS